MRIYRTLLIGAGRIAAGYDKPEDSAILTHCHALLGHPRFELLGIYDRNPAALSQACTKWGVPAYFELGNCADLRPDIVVICTSDESHADFLDMLIGWSPRLVVCEKPLTLSLADSIRSIDQYEAAGIDLSVVYQRRFDSDVNVLRQRIYSGELGAFLTGTLLYSKGLLHNGSHGVDLLIYLFGKVLSSQVYGIRGDYREEDPTVFARLKFDCGDLYLLAGDERCHSLFELDLIFEHGRYRFLDSGLTLEIYEVTEDPTFTGYKALLLEQRRPSTLDRALYEMWEHMALSLDHGSLSRNSAREILETQRVCTELLHKVAEGFQL